MTSEVIRIPAGMDAPLDPDAPAEELAKLQGQLVAFARDVNRLYRQERERSQQLEDALAELRESVLAGVQTLAFVAETKDAYTKGHLDRTHDYAVALAERICPEQAKDPVLRYGFLLHDIGKVAIPSHILSKAGPLLPEEWEVMRSHPLLGGHILTPMKFLAAAIPIIEAHHERWDGQGYPRGLKGEEIPLPARVFTIADTLDAMTSDRPYRPALRFEEAVEEIKRNAGTQFDPEVVEAFAALAEERGSAWQITTPAPFD